MTIEREFQLSSIWDIALRRGARIILFAAMCAIVAGLFSLAMPNRYNSEVRLLMNKSKIGERTMQSPALPMDSYHEIFFPPSVLQEIMDEFRLEQPPTRLKHYKDFEKRISLAIRERGSTFVLRVTLETPQLAADVANALAQKAVELNESLIEQEFNRSFELIGRQYQLAKERTDRYLEDYEIMLLENNKNTVMHRLNSSNTILATLRQERMNSERALVQLSERKLWFEEILSATDFKPTIEVKRSVLSDNFSLLISRQMLEDEGDIEALVQLQFVEETPNQAYINLQEEYKKLLVDYPAEEKNYNLIVERIEEYEELVEKLEDTLNLMEIAEMEAKANYDRSLEIMGGIGKELDWAGTNIWSERQDIDIIGYAIPDDRKVFPQRSLIVFITGLIAFLLAFLFYLLTDLYGLVKTSVATIQPDQTPTA